MLSMALWPCTTIFEKFGSGLPGRWRIQTISSPCTAMSISSTFAGRPAWTKHVIAFHVVVEQLVVELAVILGHHEDAVVVGVGRERGAAAVVDEAGDAARVGAVEELAKHQLVVAEEADDAAVLLELEDRVDDPARVRAAVDVVAEEDDEGVAAQRKLLDERAQLLGAAVHVADGEHGLRIRLRGRYRSQA